SRNLFECQLAASGAVSASPSPTTQQTINCGLSNAAPYACASAYPSSPPSWMEPGVSGATCEGIPPGNENCRNRRRSPSSSWVVEKVERAYGQRVRRAPIGVQPPELGWLHRRQLPDRSISNTPPG